MRPYFVVFIVIVAQIALWSLKRFVYPGLELLPLTMQLQLSLLGARRRMRFVFIGIMEGRKGV